MLFLLGRKTAERADRQARRWVVRLDRGGLNDRELRRFERWLRDDLNLRALMRAQALWRALDLPTPEEQAPDGPAINRSQSSAPMDAARGRPSFKYHIRTHPHRRGLAV